MRGNAHARFGGRAGETERSRGCHRAPVRPYYVKAHEGAQVVSKAIVVATGVTAQGEREVLGLAVGDSEDVSVSCCNSRAPAGYRVITSPSG